MYVRNTHAHTYTHTYLYIYKMDKDIVKTLSKKYSPYWSYKKKKKAYHLLQQF